LAGLGIRRGSFEIASDCMDNLPLRAVEKVSQVSHFRYLLQTPRRELINIVCSKMLFSLTSLTFLLVFEPDSPP
jgi:hypothetical protein